MKNARIIHDGNSSTFSAKLAVIMPKPLMLAVVELNEALFNVIEPVAVHEENV